MKSNHPLKTFFFYPQTLHLFSRLIFSLNLIHLHIHPKIIHCHLNHHRYHCCQDQIVYLCRSLHQHNFVIEPASFPALVFITHFDISCRLKEFNFHLFCWNFLKIHLLNKCFMNYCLSWFNYHHQGQLVHLKNHHLTYLSTHFHQILYLRHHLTYH